ncbi:unnamed protein product [Rotaria sp. Silwood1]|nr:unnamed protein product [Rotaria sp. Silwood1]
MKIQVLLIVLLILKYWTLANEDLSKEDPMMKNAKMSINDNFTIAAINTEKTYVVYFQLDKIKTSPYVLKYKHDELYVHSLYPLKMTSKYIISFVQIALNTTSKSVVLSRITMNLRHFNNVNGFSRTIFHKTIWKEDPPQRMLLKVHLQEKYAYVVANSFILSYDLITNEFHMKRNHTRNALYPHSFDLTNGLAIVTGMCKGWMDSKNRLCLVVYELRTLDLKDQLYFDRSDILTSDGNYYNRNSKMSVSINPSGTLVAVGLPQLNQVIIAFMDDNVTSSSILRYIEIPAKPSEIAFGRSVAWLDDQGALAILVGRSETHAWSQSTIKVYKNVYNSADNGSSAFKVDFTLPNNQQTFTGINNSPGKCPHSFLNILVWSSGLLVVLENFTVVYIPFVAAGFSAMEPLKIDLNSSTSEIAMNIYPSVYYLKPRPCISGTYKNASGPGPCTVCPSGTKNPGVNATMQCQPCYSTLSCPLGASAEVDLYQFRTYTQTFNYPDSPIIDNYDDVLVFNFFPNDWSPGCFFFSPIFFAVFSTVISFITWTIMLLVKRRQPTSFDIHRKRAKIFFKRIDLIGEGERLAGGLASIVIFAIIIYSIFFANHYFASYSLEDPWFGKNCKDKPRNVKYDNALQLPLPENEGKDWEIFNLLDNQKFNMTVYLINTAAKCNDITVQHNKLRGIPDPIPITYCNSPKSNFTTSFTFPLPNHRSTIQVNITGPYFIGALRLCLHGHSQDESDENVDSTLEELDVCTLFDVEHQTIGLTTYFNVHLIKIINVTKPLKRDDTPQHHGRWKPIIKYTDDLSEELYYAKNGEYLRYASDKTMFTVTLDEENYFLQNNQSPIIRYGAITFHTTMFIFLFIDTIAMVFVLYKLWGQPLVQHLLPFCYDHHKHEFQLNHKAMSVNVSYFV